jgi:hypothetical protein
LHCPAGWQADPPIHDAPLSRNHYWYEYWPTYSNLRYNDSLFNHSVTIITGYHQYFRYSLDSDKRWGKYSSRWV